jgi:type II secretory pathway predicted ATPase ExeA
MTYEAHFGLRRRPFRTTPDSEYYYPGTSHEAALARLLQAIDDKEGLALLTGEPGTGKTLLCHRLLERLGPNITSAFLTNSHLPDRTSLLQAILFELSQPYQGQREQELRLFLTENLLNNYSAGRQTVLIIDEAHHLGPELFEELRMLGNLAARHGRALQVILVAQPSLLTTLVRPELAVFSQRLAVRITLEPLGKHEAADYLVHHLRAVGGRPEKILTDEALDVLAAGTHGLPRLLNQAAHQALTIALSAEASIVDAEAAMEALAILGLEVPQAGEGAAALSPLNEDSSDTEIREETAADPVLPLPDQKGPGTAPLTGRSRSTQRREDDPPYRRLSPPKRPA